MVTLRSPRNYLLSFCLIAGILAFGVPEARAADVYAAEVESQEYQIKAAFILNFLKFIEWPPKVFSDPSAPIVIGILGEDPFNGALEQITQGQTVQGRRIALRWSRQVEDMKTCQVLFISRSEEKLLSHVFDSLGGMSVLTISDAERFAENGGIICLIKQENKIRFQINTHAAGRAGLKISSKLLRLAEIIQPANSQRSGMV